MGGDPHTTHGLRLGEGHGKERCCICKDTDPQWKQHFLKQTMRLASALGTAMESQAPPWDFSTDLGLLTQKGEGLLPFIWPPEKKNP